MDLDQFDLTEMHQKQQLTMRSTRLARIIRSLRFAAPTSGLQAPFVSRYSSAVSFRTFPSSINGPPPDLQGRFKKIRPQTCLLPDVARRRQLIDQRNGNIDESFCWLAVSNGIQLQRPDKRVSTRVLKSTANRECRHDSFCEIQGKCVDEQRSESDEQSLALPETEEDATFDKFAGSRREDGIEDCRNALGELGVPEIFKTYGEPVLRNNNQEPSTLRGRDSNFFSTDALFGDAAERSLLICDDEDQEESQLEVVIPAGERSVRNEESPLPPEKSNSDDEHVECCTPNAAQIREYLIHREKKIRFGSCPTPPNSPAIELQI